MSTGATIEMNVHIYDGWNLIGEMNVCGSLIREYVWGLDLSDTEHGAGGVGGLLVFRDTTDTYYTTYDGNRNVTGLVDPSDGSTPAVYEYDPFGNLLRSTGTIAQANPFRFSTKYQDGETGLVYYGYRWYDSVLGRWLSRDPIQEAGGLNLYGFVANSPMDVVDMLGLEISGPERILAYDKTYSKRARNAVEYKTEREICRCTVDGHIAEFKQYKYAIRVYPVSESKRNGDSEITAEYTDGSVETKTITVIRPKWVTRTFDGDTRLHWRATMHAYLTIYDQLLEPLPEGITVDEIIRNYHVKGGIRGPSATGSGVTKPGGTVTDTFGFTFTIKSGSHLQVDQTILIGNWEADLYTVIWTFLDKSESAMGIVPSVRMRGTRVAEFQ